MLYWANKANMPNSANTFVFTAIGRNRAKAFVITADEFNKPNYLLVEINGLDRVNLVISG